MTVFIVIKRLLFSVGIAAKDQGQSCVVQVSFLSNFEVMKSLRSMSPRVSRHL